MALINILIKKLKEEGFHDIVKYDESGKATYFALEPVLEKIDKNFK